MFFCSSNKRVASLALSAFCALLVLVSACSREPHSDKVKGDLNVIVKFGEKAVTYGFVNLSNNQTGLGAGQLLDQNGVAQLKKVPVGDYVITVTLPPPETAVANHVVKETSELPQKYRSETTSTLRATVQKGTSEITVNLKD